MFARLQYLLLQMRNADDPMRAAEVRSFARTLEVPEDRIRVFDLLTGFPSRQQLENIDVVLLGGSGDYSATDDGAWIEPILDGLRGLCAQAKPTFASCWGFQAMARAMGGLVVHDASRAEIGTLELQLTPAGAEDAVFGALPATFTGQAGHEDCVDRLPSGATLLASSEKVAHQAYCLDGLPIYCTQFHPELSRDDLLERLRAYPRYVERIAGMTLEEFAHRCGETAPAAALLRRFVAHVFDIETKDDAH